MSNINVEPEIEAPVAVPNLNRRPRNELKKADRFAAMQYCLAKSVDGVVPYAVTLEVANRFNVCDRTIQRMWKRFKENNYKEYTVRRETNCGKKRSPFELENLLVLSVTQRKSIRQTAFNGKVPKSTLFDRFRAARIRRHSNTIKPFLTPACHALRMQHCLYSLDQCSIPNNPRFQSMHNVVHIDEKWFLMSRKVEHYYILPGEVEPYRNIRSANYIEKVMFLAAVARPRYDTNGVCTFDGKIGVFPLVRPVAAKRKSVNRPRGTIEIKPIPRINRSVIRNFVINKILPAIVSKWPRESLSEGIYIQQDNAPSHLPINDPAFLVAAAATGLPISLINQPPNSPDLNVLDLGFFRAIQSLQTQECTTNVPQLIEAVDNAFYEFDHTKCNSVFLTLQSCMVEILKTKGGNRYKTPHMAKDRLRRQGLLPYVISCPVEVYDNAVIQQSQ